MSAETPGAETPASCCYQSYAPSTTGARLSALRAEWIKLRTLSGTWWLLLAVITLTVAVGAAAASAVNCTAAGCGQDPAKVALSGVDLSQVPVAILAVLAITGEYSNGMIRTTLTAMPRRLTVLFAKAVVVTVLTLAAGTVGVLASALAGRLLLPGHGFTPDRGYVPLSLASGPGLRAAAGSVIYLALIALLALGAGTAVRDSATAIGVVLGLVYLFPVIASALGPGWSRRLEQIGPMTAGLSIQATIGLRRLPLAPWQGLGVLALWAAGALLIGGLVLGRRDSLSLYLGAMRPAPIPHLTRMPEKIFVNIDVYLELIFSWTIECSHDPITGGVRQEARTPGRGSSGRSRPRGRAALPGAPVF